MAVAPLLLQRSILWTCGVCACMALQGGCKRSSEEIATTAPGECGTEDCTGEHDSDGSGDLPDSGTASADAADASALGSVGTVAVPDVTMLDPTTSPLYPPLSEAPFMPDANTQWIVETEHLSNATALVGWPVQAGQVHAPVRVTPDEDWVIRQLVLSPDGKLKAFLREAYTTALPSGCHGYTVALEGDTPLLTEHCYPVRPLVSIPKHLSWLDNTTLLVSLREPDQEETEVSQWFIHELQNPTGAGTGTVSEILPNVDNAYDVSASPDGSLFLVGTRHPDPEEIYLVRRGAESTGQLMSTDSSFNSGEEHEGDVRWAPNSEAVALYDSGQRRLRLFDLSTEPMEIDLSSFGADGLRDFTLSERQLLFAPLVVGEPPLLWGVDFKTGDFQQFDLPAEVTNLTQLAWDSLHSQLYALATLAGERRSTLLRVSFQGDGTTENVLMDHADRQALTPVTLLADGTLMARTRPSENLPSPISLLLWSPGSPDSVAYYGPEQQDFDRLVDAFPSSDPRDVMVNMATSSGEYRLVLYRNGESHLLGSASRTQDVIWLPDNAGVFARSYSDFLWSDLRDGSPAPWIDVTLSD